MIYETAVVVRPEATDKAVESVKSNIKDVISQAGGNIIVEDDWGMKTFAQPTEKGTQNGRYVYFMYQADGNSNTELERRYRISEDVLKFIVVKLGADRDLETIKKNYRNPNSKPADDGKGKFDAEKEKKLFAKRKSCWFSAKKVSPDWKDPSTYSWLVNEFGKISPARVTGLRPKFQRSATTAIKRGRAMGLISYMSNRTLR
jgi:small subunit ribosomal protein S6